MSEQQQNLIAWFTKASKVAQRAGLEDIEVACLGAKEAVAASAVENFADSSARFYTDRAATYAVELIGALP